MANPFDRFDAADEAAPNPFDRFDVEPQGLAAAAPRQPVSRRAGDFFASGLGIGSGIGKTYGTPDVSGLSFFQDQPEDLREDPTWAESFGAGSARGFEDLALTVGHIMEGDKLRSGEVSMRRLPETTLDQPMTFGELVSRPGRTAKKAIHGLARFAPTAIGAIAGAAAGAPAAGASGLAATTGTLAGASGGAGLMTMLQTLGPSFDEALKKYPDDPDKAYKEAIDKTMIGTGGAMAGTALLGVNPFSTQVKNLLFQTFGVQPAAGVAASSLQRLRGGDEFNLDTAAEDYLNMVAPGFLMGLAADFPIAAIGDRAAARTPPTTPKTEPKPAANPFDQFDRDASRRKPADAGDPDQMQAARDRITPEPSDAQKAAGNYRKGHVKWNGFDVAVETPQGGTRRGIGADGEPWEVQQPFDYGYVKGTKGADGDPVDVYLGPDPNAPKIFAIDQINADTKKFDEHKFMLGFPDRETAERAYDAAFSDGKGPERRSAVTEMTIPEFREFVDSAGERAARKPVAETLKAKQEAEALKAAHGALTPVERQASVDEYFHAIENAEHAGWITKQQGSCLAVRALAFDRRRDSFAAPRPDRAPDRRNPRRA